MVHQKDYVLRIIEQMAIMIAELRRRIMGGQSANVDQDLRTIANNARVDLSLIRTLDGKAILSLLSPGGEPEPTQVWMVAEVLYLDGLAARDQGDLAKAENALVKARLLYGVLDYGVVASVVPEAANRTQEIDEILRGMID